MDKLLRITIDGRSCEVPQGITVAAALAHAGSGITRHSVDATPRAPFCGMGICQECRVTVDGRAHNLACQTLCGQGMIISTAAASAPLAGAIAAGSQRSASLYFDVLIIGAGPAGLAAAQIAAGGGEHVGVIDDNPQAGGQIWRHGPKAPAPKKAQALLQSLSHMSNVSLMHNTRVVQQLAPDCLLLEGLQHSCVVRFRRLILATVARERLLPFPGWTLPGVTGAGGLQALIKGGMPVAGQRIVIAGSGPLLFAAAATAQAHGATVVAIIEQSPPAALARFLASLCYTPGKLAQAAWLRFGLRGTPYLLDSHVISASGQANLEQIQVRHGTRQITLACDRLACGYGLLPNLRMAQALQCAQDGPAIRVDALQRTSLPNVFAAGECTGIGGMELSFIEGQIAAYAALGNEPAARALFKQRAKWQRFAARLAEHFSLSSALRNLPDADTLICRCEDISYAAVTAHSDWRNAKLHTRCGMGPCQGQICGTAAGFCLGWPDPAIRAPFTPSRIGTLMQTCDTLAAAPEQSNDGVMSC